jgi:hypothetical protein
MMDKQSGLYPDRQHLKEFQLHLQTDLHHFHCFLLQRLLEMAIQKMSTGTSTSI